MSALKTTPEIRKIWFEEAEKLKLACENTINNQGAVDSKELKTILFFNTLGNRIQTLIKDLESLESQS